MNETGTSTDPQALMPLMKLAKQLPCVRGEKPPHYTTLYRWATRGLQSRSGRMLLSCLS